MLNILIGLELFLKENRHVLKLEYLLRVSWTSAIVQLKDIFKKYNW